MVEMVQKSRMLSLSLIWVKTDALIGIVVYVSGYVWHSCMHGMLCRYSTNWWHKQMAL